MKILIPIAALALLAWIAPSFGLEASKISEIKPGPGQESIMVFLRRLPSSFEAQIFYGLFCSGLAGAVASWLWKWSNGQAGLAHFTLQYGTKQLLWLAGSAIGLIMTVGFQTPSGEFFGWLDVLVTGAAAGFGGEVKVDRKPWTPEERAAAEAKP